MGHKYQDDPEGSVYIQWITDLILLETEGTKSKKYQISGFWLCQNYVESEKYYFSGPLIIYFSGSVNTVYR